MSCRVSIDADVGWLGHELRMCFLVFGNVVCTCAKGHLSIIGSENLQGQSGGTKLSCHILNMADVIIQCGGLLILGLFLVALTSYQCRHASQAQWAQIIKQPSGGSSSPATRLPSCLGIWSPIVSLPCDTTRQPGYLTNQEARRLVNMCHWTAQAIDGRAY